MIKFIFTFILLALAVPGYCREQSDIATHKAFLQEIINTMSQQPNRNANKVINVKATKAVDETKTKKSGKNNLNKFKAEKYDFSNSTSYGNFKILVMTTSEHSFDVSFLSESPIQMYQLRDSITKNITTKGELNDVLNYTFTVQFAFTPKYVLLLSMYKDGVITQNIIPLYKKMNVKYAE